MEQEKKSKIRPKFILLIIGILLLSIGGGIFGEFFTRFYLSNLTFFSDLYFTEANNLGQKEIIIREPRKVVVEQDLILSQIQGTIGPSIMNIYQRVKTGKNLLDKIYLPSDSLGQAVVLTSDGWLLAANDNLIDSSENVLVGYDNKIYNIEKIVADNESNMIFIKIAAQNLAVIKFADWQKITNGEQVLVYDNYGKQLNLVNILAKRYKTIVNKYDLVNSSQSLERSLLVSKSFSQNLKGAPIFNFQNELIGFLIAPDGLFNRALPVNYLNPVINQIFKGEQVKRPYLGINYLDLSQVVGLSADERQGKENGAMIWSDQTGISIKSDSPLAGKLIKGDIIISLENQNLDENNDLQDLLMEYKSNQDIRLKYLHQNAEKEISITLK
ncbi:MAG: S1C family serine protease [Candidatus Parcubacteria bacterium]|nr:S1C family serine protease [Candidatus Parcubacteria bacterium]